MRRKDTAKRELIACSPEAVSDTLLATTVKNAKGTTVGTVEHLLSALWAAEIDNALVELDGPEVPIMDGSAIAFVMLIQDAGTVEQDAPRRVWKIKRKIEVADSADPNRWARLEPHVGQRFQVTIDYKHPLIRAGGQQLRFDAEQGNYASEIACARTFGFIEEIDWLRSNERALGGSLDNALVFERDRVCNREGLRMPDECLRHKMLDAIGDCYIGATRFEGRYVASKPGHALNNRLMRELAQAAPECADLGEAEAAQS